MVSIDINVAQLLDRPSLSGVGDADARIEAGAYRGVLMRAAAVRDLGRIRALIHERGGSFVAFTS